MFRTAVVRTPFREWRTWVLDCPSPWWPHPPRRYLLAWGRWHPIEDLSGFVLRFD
jgi:hypothetical protein